MSASASVNERRFAAFGREVFAALRAESIGDSEAEWELWQFAVRCGLAERVPYDPAVHGEIEDAEPGDDVTVPVKGVTT